MYLSLLRVFNYGEVLDFPAHFKIDSQSYIKNLENMKENELDQ